MHIFFHRYIDYKKCNHIGAIINVGEGNRCGSGVWWGKNNKQNKKQTQVEKDAPLNDKYDNINLLLKIFGSAGWTEWSLYFLVRYEMPWSSVPSNFPPSITLQLPLSHWSSLLTALWVLPSLFRRKIAHSSHCVLNTYYVPETEPEALTFRCHWLPKHSNGEGNAVTVLKILR